MSKETTTRLPIDKEALRKILQKVGSIEDIAENLGYTTTSLKTSITSKTITKPLAKAFANVYGIDYDEYRPKEEPKANVSYKEKPKANASYKQEIEDPVERYLLMILKELRSMNETIARRRK